MTVIPLLRYGLAGLTMFLAVSCANTQPYYFYTLSAIQPVNQSAITIRHHKPSGVTITAVSFPDYIDRPQIVTRPTINTLRIHEFHRWGGSLEADFVRTLNENLSTLLEAQPISSPNNNEHQPFDYQISLVINQFDGKLGEQVVLDVDWEITKQDNEKNSWFRRLVIREPVESSNYELLVIAQSQAVEQLSHHIVDMIREINSGI